MKTRLFELHTSSINREKSRQRLDLAFTDVRFDWAGDKLEVTMHDGLDVKWLMDRIRVIFAGTIVLTPAFTDAELSQAGRDYDEYRRTSRELGERGER